MPKVRCMRQGRVFLASGLLRRAIIILVIFIAMSIFTIHFIFSDGSVNSIMYLLNFFGGKIALNSQKSRDEELRLFCNLKNIKLIEIPYSLSFAEITTILDDNLS